MSRHYVCGQYEDSYQAPKLKIWETKESLRPAASPAISSPIKTMCTSDVYNNNGSSSMRSSPTKFLVNNQGHLMNRSPTSPTSFNKLPVQGFSTKPRWPMMKSTSLRHAGSATFGFKGSYTQISPIFYRSFLQIDKFK